MDNREFVQYDKVFRMACKLAKVKKTKRQASKFRNNRGLAFTKKKLATTVIKSEERS